MHVLLIILILAVAYAALSVSIALAISKVLEHSRRSSQRTDLESNFS